MSSPRFRLTLYVTRDSSGKALADLYKALQMLAYNDYQLNIVDVVAQPELAMDADITETPCLVYHAADGDRVIREVSDVRIVRKTLGIVV